ncbi:Vacuolar protein sorting-associated protein 68 [Lachnellula cervina]|uniref:Vacuolar protein sorting-associated protein 68 n=1 Tax=Lachnellula cervina TaxID=1316786 RepID=A0A7D8UI09_9HELO|nr:Vacuolar protein sorting-associated protein 68 [Lachnellula cervina]
MSEERLWKFRKPEWMNSAVGRSAGVYVAGALFSLSFFLLLDAAVFSHSKLNGSDPPIHIAFIDWLPLIFSSLGMLIINSIEKTRLSADSFSYSGSGVAWKARVVLFLGFASLAGGMAGGVTVLVLKYVVPGVLWPGLWMGVANVLANGGVMLSSVVLWVSQNMEDEYSYNLAL